jgi:hypothetical protein
MNEGVGRVGSTVENIEQRLLEASSDQSMKMDMLMTSINEVNSFHSKVCNFLQY